MKTMIWLMLGLVLLLGGCALAPYEAPTRQETPWYLHNGIPPLPVSPEVQ
jgi:hypothetical protein